MRLDTPKQAEDFLSETQDAYRPTWNALIDSISTDRCMYEGCQWLHKTQTGTVSAQTGRRYTNWNPDTNKLVATVNRIIPLIRECAAATFPTRMEFDVSPPDRDFGIEAAERAHVLESALSAVLGDSGYLNASNDANFRRCVDGTHGIGLRIKTGMRMVGGQEEGDQVLTAFAFDATKLILDPFNQSRDLTQHEHVTYMDVWTRDAIKATYGVDLAEDECQTIGELCGLQIKLNQLSENRLYANLPKYSKTKGALVYQIHAKDDAGRFSTMLIGIKPARPRTGTNIRWINFDNQETPFGGPVALPFTLLHGAMRPDSMWSLSDAFLLKDDQDRLNLLQTFLFRILQKSAGYQWLVSKGSVIGKDNDNFRQQFTNMVAGYIEYEGGTRDRPNPPPAIVQTPSPPPFINELVQVYESAQRRMVHREDITSGAYKTHTPSSTFQTANENAQQVLGNRVIEDIRAHEPLLQTALGTAVKLAQEGSPSMLATLKRAGFDETDFAQLSQVDPRYPACSITIREESIRNESKDKKEQRLWSAVTAQAITPLKLRMALSDLGTSMDDTDKQMMNAARKYAVRVMLGEQWQPISLGEHTEMFLAEFRRAAVADRRAQVDPGARQRLYLAIESMLAYANMEMQQQAMASQPPAPAPAAPAGAGEQQEMPQEVNVSDLITSLNNGGGSDQSSAQPEAA